MDIVKHNMEAEVSGRDDLQTQLGRLAILDEDSESLRTKTSLRMHYEAHTEVIKKQIGNLEEIRVRLGLSARKMCQLLLVDPSAWTRWKKEDAPPHIWRALQWYMIVQEKLPGLTPQYFTGKDVEIMHSETLKKMQGFEQQFHQKNLDLIAQNQELATKILVLETAVRANRMTAVMLGLATLIMGGAMFYALKMR